MNPTDFEFPLSPEALQENARIDELIRQGFEIPAGCDIGPAQQNDPTQRTYNTDPEYWRKYAESLMPVIPQQGKDYVREYGVFVGGSRVRHFIDKPAGGNVTLCGLPCVFVEGASIDAERTCDVCSERQAELRSK